MKLTNKDVFKFELSDPGKLSTAGTKLFTLRADGTERHVYYTKSYSRACSTDSVGWYHGSIPTWSNSQVGYICENDSNQWSTSIYLAPNTSVLSNLVTAYISMSKLSLKTMFWGSTCPKLMLFAEGALFGTTAFGGRGFGGVSYEKVCSPKIFCAQVGTFADASSDKPVLNMPSLITLGRLSTASSSFSDKLAITVNPSWNISENMKMCPLGGILISKVYLVVVKASNSTLTTNQIYGCDTYGNSATTVSGFLSKYGVPSDYKILYESNGNFDYTRYNRRNAVGLLDIADQSGLYTGTVKSGVAQTDIKTGLHYGNKYNCLGLITDYRPYDSLIPPIFTTITPVNEGSCLCSIPTNRNLNLNFLPLYGCNYSIWGVQASQRYGEFYIQSGEILANATQDSTSIYGLGTGFSIPFPKTVDAKFTVHADTVLEVLASNTEMATRATNYYSGILAVSAKTFNLIGNPSSLATPSVYANGARSSRLNVKKDATTSIQAVGPSPVGDSIIGYYKDSSWDKPEPIFSINPKWNGVAAYTIFSSYTIV